MLLFSCRAHFEAAGYTGPFQIAVNATAVLQTVRVNLKEQLMYGLCCGAVPTGTFEEMEQAIKTNKLATQAYAFILAPFVDGVNPYILAIVPVKDKESADTVLQWQSDLTRKAIHSGVHVLGFGADGDSKVRKHWHNMFSFSPGDDGGSNGGNGIIYNYSLDKENFVLPFADGYHLIKKLRNQVLNVKRLLIIGKDLIMLEYMKDMWNGDSRLRFESHLWESDLYVKDKQNVAAALRFFHTNAR